MGEEKEEYSIIGRPLIKVDAMAKVTGETKFADDLALPRMLHAKLLRSPHPHARILSIDTGPAEALPGVHAVLTGRALPIKFGILPVSQDEEALATEKVRYVGDPVAAVAAVDEETAEAACRLIRVEYEVLPALMSVGEALAREDVRIHDYGPRGNIHKEVALEFGDVEEGFAQADHVREDVFFYEGSTHLPMEQHAALASHGPDGKLCLWSSTQTPHYVHRALAKVLELPASHIRVIALPNGGGFGGKSDPFSHEIVVCKLSMLTGRPVKICLTREEVFYAHRGRHPVTLWFKTGPPCGPKRGHGTPQPRCALEVHLDKLAEALGLDPSEMRRRHLVQPNSVTVNQLRIGTVGLGACLDRVVERSGWKAKHRKLPFGHGIGVAGSAYISGAGLPIYWNALPHSGVQIKIDRGGGVAVFCGSTDIGQGSDSVLAYVAAEELGIEPEDIRVVTADTDLTPVDLGSYSSRVTLMTGNATIQAARKLRAQLFEAAAEKLGVPFDRLRAAHRRIFDRDNPEAGIGFVEAAVLAEAKFGTLGAVGSYTPPKGLGKYKGAGVGPTPTYSYSAAVVELTVDPETGFITVDKVWLAHDIGKAINPLLVIGQIEGSVYMALGEALMEEQAFRKGVHKIPSMLEYKSPTFLETPQMESILVGRLPSVTFPEPTVVQPTGA
ncbi:MAG: molybdopterin-dependent oxidoreductase [candidate division NC10 bacterium]|nr:molybdopterin-dependent oxidoreductase [candidate division NC10 bacterium]